MPGVAVGHRNFDCLLDERIAQTDQSQPLVVTVVVLGMFPQRELTQLRPVAQRYGFGDSPVGKRDTAVPVRTGR